MSIFKLMRVEDVVLQDLRSWKLHPRESDSDCLKRILRQAKPSGTKIPIGVQTPIYRPVASVGSPHDNGAISSDLQIPQTRI